MNVFISADMEGVAGVVHQEHTDRNGREHDRARLLMTEEVNAAVRGALKVGAKKVVVNDSHGTMRNLLPEKLHPEAELISGSPKTLSMMEGISSDFDAVMLLGHHARAGKHGILSHSFNGKVVRDIRVNGKEYGEIGLNAAIAGYFDVPVVLVSGCQFATAEAAEMIENVETAQVKTTVNRVSARSISPVKAHELLEEKAEKALANVKEMAPFKLEGPVQFEVDYLQPGLADTAGVLPIVERVDEHTHRFKCEDYLEAFRYFRALVALAGTQVKGEL